MLPSIGAPFAGAGGEGGGAKERSVFWKRMHIHAPDYLIALSGRFFDRDVSFRKQPTPTAPRLARPLRVCDKRVSGLDRDMIALSGFEYVTAQCSFARPLSRHLSHFRAWLKTERFSHNIREHTRGRGPTELYRNEGCTGEGGAEVMRSDAPSPHPHPGPPCLSLRDG